MNDSSNPFFQSNQWEHDFGQLDSALRILNCRWSSTTKFLHGQGKLFSSISIEDNLLFSLLLMRSHRLQEVLKARDLLLRLLCWQIPLGPAAGLFPRFLHCFPEPGSLRWQKWLLAILALILKTQTVPCGMRLAKMLKISLQKLMRALETCTVKQHDFEDNVASLTLCWLQRYERLSNESIASPLRSAFAPNWKLGPEKSAILACLASEFSDQKNCTDTTLPHWHGQGAGWCGLLHRSVFGCNKPLDLLTALFEPQCLLQLQDDETNLHRLTLLRAVVSKDLASNFKKLKPNFSCTQHQLIDHGQGATFFSTTHLIGACLENPVRDNSDTSKHWDLARFAWSRASQSGSCRLQIDADDWVETPQFSFDGQKARLQTVFTTKPAQCSNRSPFFLFCKKQKGDGWYIGGARTLVFRTEDQLEYFNDSIKLKLKLTTADPNQKWIGYIQLAQTVRKIGEADHWRIWIRSSSNPNKGQIVLDFEITEFSEATRMAKN